MLFGKLHDLNIYLISEDIDPSRKGKRGRNFNIGARIQMRKAYSKWVGKARGDRREKAVTTRELPEQHGFQIVYGGENPTLDLVAIHGHGGQPVRSWTDRESGIFWLRDLLPSILPETRILSYGYDTSDALSISVEEIAMDLLSQLDKLRRETGTQGRPLIFLAHSFGGPLLKGALGIALTNEVPGFSDIQSSTRGILFFGVVQSLEGSLGNIGESEEDSPADSALIRALKRDMRWLRYSNVGFSPENLMISHFIETSNVVIVNDMDTQTTLDRSKRVFDTGTMSSIQLNKTHGGIIRFSNANDPDFQQVVRCLHAMAAEATVK